MTRPRRGLSLVEVLVVIGIVAILLGLFLPSVRRVRGAAARTTCANNQRHILLALNNYEGNRRKLPPGCLGPAAADPADRLGWPVALLPYLEQGDLATRFDPAAGIAGNAGPAGEVVKVFRCPAAKPDRDTPWPLTSYVGCGGVGADAPGRPPDAPGVGLLGFDRQLRFSDIMDGLSNTLAVLEAHDRPGPWARGGGSTLRGVGPETVRTGPHEGGGLIVGMADGSVRTVDERLPLAMLLAAATVAGGEPAPDLE